MGMKKIISIVLGMFIILSVIYLVVSEINTNTTQTVLSSDVEVETPSSVETEKNQESTESNTVVSIKKEQTEVSNTQTTKKIVNGLYFHGTHRCYTCNLMEGYIRDVIKESFSKEVKKGLLTFQSINVEEPVNSYYIQYYQLRSISFFLSLKKDGKELTFVNLDKIWRLARQKTEFKKYIKSEIKKYLEM